MAAGNLETEWAILSLPMTMVSMRGKEIDYFIAYTLNFVAGIEINPPPPPYLTPFDV